MTNSFDLLNKLKQEQEEAHEKYVKAAAPLVTSAIQEQFNQLPELFAIQWRQYTPSYNDGEPCVFSVSYPEFCIIEDVEVMQKELSNTQEFEDYETEFDFKSYYRHEKFSDNLEKFRSHFDDIDTAILEHLFGDSSKVTVYRNGKTTLTEYCDY